MAPAVVTIATKAAPIAKAVVEKVHDKKDKDEKKSKSSKDKTEAQIEEFVEETWEEDPEKAFMELLEEDLPTQKGKKSWSTE